MIYIDNIRKSEKTLNRLYPNAIYLDVTSKAKNSLVKLSPFYPHGNIPIPYSLGKTAMCVECIWQGLKVFEKFDIDLSSFQNSTMRNIKRTVRKYGLPLGHRKGVSSDVLLDYIHARIYIYLPCYLWVLNNKVTNIIERLRIYSEQNDVVLLDFETNCDVLDPRKPLSHAFLVKAFIENNFPKNHELKTELFERQNLKYITKKVVLKPLFAIDNIINFIENYPKTSKEIIKHLNINIRPRALTSILKKEKQIEVINSKPLKFKKLNTSQTKLF